MVAIPVAGCSGSQQPHGRSILTNEVDICAAIQRLKRCVNILNDLNDIFSDQEYDEWNDPGFFECKD